MYAAILADRPDPRRLKSKPGSYDDFRRRYYEYIERQREDVEEKLALFKLQLREQATGDTVDGRRAEAPGV